MAFAILQTVLFGVWIEVPAGGFEVGGIAFRDLMNVDGMVAGREIVKLS